MLQAFVQQPTKRFTANDICQPNQARDTVSVMDSLNDWIIVKEDYPLLLINSRLIDWCNDEFLGLKKKRKRKLKQLLTVNFNRYPM